MQEWDREKMRKKAIELEQEPNKPQEEWRQAVERLLQLTGYLAARFSVWEAAGAHTATKWILAMIDEFGIYEFGRMLLETGANEKLSDLDVLMTSDDLEVRAIITDFYTEVGMPREIIYQIWEDMDEYKL